VGGGDKYKFPEVMHGKGESAEWRTQQTAQSSFLDYLWTKNTIYIEGNPTAC